MKKLGVYEQIDFRRQSLRFMAPEYDFIPLDYEHFKREIMAAFPAERGRLNSYFAAVDPLYRSMHRLMAGAFGQIVADDPSHSPPALAGELGRRRQGEISSAKRNRCCRL